MFLRLVGTETTLEEIVQHVLSQRSILTREEILAAIEKKRVASEGLLTEEAAARLVAAELGVEMKLEERLPTIRISQLVSGLNDVTVSGRVLFVYKPRASVSPEKGVRMAKLLIGDKTGTVSVVLWDDKAGLAEGVRRAQILKVVHGYVRRSKTGEVELHVGQRGDIQTLSPEVGEGDFPEVEDFCTKIEAISERDRRVHVKGVMRMVSAVSTFQRRDGAAGKVARALLEDGSGQIPAVFWNEKAEDLGEVKEGAVVLLLNARVRRNRQDGKLELHVEGFAHAEVLHHSGDSLRLGDLVEGMQIVSIEGVVASKPILREVTTKRGEKVSVASFELEDAHGRVWVSAWREHAKRIEGLGVGARMRLRDVFVRRGFGGQLEISTRASSAIDVEG